MQAAIAQEGIALEVVSGGEVSLSWALEAPDDRLALASYGQRGRDILIETPSVGGAGLPQMLSRIQGRGYRVVLAHPERLPDFQRDPSMLDRLAEQGIVLQVNADAIAGPRRSPVAKLARRLCASGRASVVASDGHRGERWRPVTALAHARGPLSKLADDQVATAMLESAPAAILAGEPLPRSVPVWDVSPRRNWWRL